MSVRVAIRSDRRLFHDALAACLTACPDTVVVGHVTTGRDLLDLCRLRTPDIIVFDAGPDIATVGWSLAELVARYPKIRLIVTYEQLTRAGVTIAARLGIEALIPHSHGLAALLATLRHHAELLTTTPAATEPELPIRPPGRRGGFDHGLTDREREIITLLGAGHTAGRVAQLLSISPGMVESSKRRIYRKMGVASQSHAISRAALLGLMDRPAPRRPPRAPADGPLCVSIIGPDTGLLRRITATLADRQVPFQQHNGVHAHSNGAVDSHDGGQPRPAVAIIGDPEPDIWIAIEKIDIPVLMVTSRQVSPVDAVDAITRGVVAMIAAQRVEQDLVPALTLTVSGHLTISAALGHSLVAEIRARPGGISAALPAITPREHDILDSIASGHSVRQTARALGIAEKTVENIQARLFRKLGVHNRAGAVAAAHGLGLLDGNGANHTAG